MVARQGARHHNAKMTTAKVKHARKLFATGDWTIAKLAAKYGVAHQTMSAILKRVTWKSVED